MGISTSVIVSLVIASILAIAALGFMIFAIIQKSNCENTESAQCATFTCPDPNDPTAKGTPAVRP